MCAGTPDAGRGRGALVTSVERRDGVPRLALSPAEAAIALSVSERSVRQLIDEGALPHVRLGRRILVTIDDLRAFLEARRVSPNSKEAS